MEQEERQIHASVTKSETAYTVNVVSTPANGPMTAWQLRDFVRALDKAGIPDNARILDTHNHQTATFMGLRVHHTFTVTPAEESSDA
jgi:hypothetical protein